MLSALALDGVVLHETTTRAVASASGLFGIAPVRRSVRVRPTADGAIDDSLYRDEKLVTIAGDVWTNAGDVSLAFAEFRVLSAAFLATLATPGVLTWTEGASGLALQRTVKLASAVEPPLAEAATLISYGVVLSSADPNAYSQTLTTAVGNALSGGGGGDVFADVFVDTFAASGGGVASFTNAGNAPTRPLLRIYGTCSNPAVVLGAKRITLNGSIGAGEYVEIDLMARTVVRVLSGITTNARSMVDPANTQWFSFPPGVSLPQLIAATFDTSAHLEVVGRSAYA